MKIPTIKNIILKSIITCGIFLLLIGNIKTIINENSIFKEFLPKPKFQNFDLNAVDKFTQTMEFIKTLPISVLMTEIFPIPKFSMDSDNSTNFLRIALAVKGKIISPFTKNYSSIFKHVFQLFLFREGKVRGDGSLKLFNDIPSNQILYISVLKPNIGPWINYVAVPRGTEKTANMTKIIYID